MPLREARLVAFLFVWLNKFYGWTTGRDNVRIILKQTTMTYAWTDYVTKMINLSSLWTNDNICQKLTIINCKSLRWCKMRMEVKIEWNFDFSSFLIIAWKNILM